MRQRVLLQESFKLALSMTLFYWLALSLDWYMPKYGGLAIAVIALSTTGASVNKGVMRLVGTTAGLAVGLLGLALFAQDRWLTLLFYSSYLFVIAYFLSGSRFKYTWYVAGFLPPLLWATTYGDVDNVFHYASFRYLETCAGILIYTLISALLWPRSAGDAVDRLGSDLAAKQRELFSLYRRQLASGEQSAKAAALATGIAAAAPKLTAALQAAYADSPSINSARRTWETLRSKTRALGDALALWRESIDDARQLDLERLLPGLEGVLDTVDQRLTRISDLWRSRTAAPDDTGDRDAAPLASIALSPDRGAAAELAQLDRAALLGFVQQLEVLDLASREALGTMRVLGGVDDARDHHPHSLPPDPYRPSRWDPSRLVGALFPPLSFAVAYLLWILTDPPTGTDVPKMAVVLSLMLMMAPTNAVTFVSLWVGFILFPVAPVYIFVMPHLDSGVGILTLIFSYSFVAGLIGGRKPFAKTLMLAMFVMMADITNDQTYSILVLVNGAMMYLLAGASIAVVQLMLTPRRPEQILRSRVRRFFRGCAKVTGVMTGGEREAALRKRYYESMVMPIPAQLHAVAAKLDYRLYPDNDEGKVKQLLFELQSIAHRLQALELAHRRMGRHQARWAEPLAQVGTRWRETLQHLFEEWSSLRSVDVDEVRASLRDLAADMESRLDAAMKAASPDSLDDAVLADLYAVLGCARGLARATTDALAAVTRINWDAWAQARF